MKIIKADGFTLVEISITIVIISIVALALAASYASQSVVNEHAENLTTAAHDANRVLEAIQENNLGCSEPIATLAGGGDAWLEAQTPAKSMGLGDATTEEQIFITCQDQDGGALNSDYCGPDQVSNSEWAVGAANTDFDPIRVTVSVCWRHRDRVIGECTWGGGALSASDTDTDGVIDSPVMLSTMLTCR